MVRSTASKEALRARIGAVRRALSPQTVRAASKQIAERVVALPEFSHARVVGCYLALGHEVQTMELVKRCWREDKEVCVPAFEDARRGYVLAWLKMGEATETGPAKILQPKKIRPASPKAVDLMIVPAVAFDRSGRRLGHGGGHYDRLLAQCPGFKVGVAFEAQMVEEVPSDIHDVGVDIVVTERRIYPLRG